MSTSTAIGTEFTKKMIDALFNAIDEGTKQAYRMLWNALLSFLSVHWLTVIIVLAVILIIAIIRALIGRWGMLGSVLYNYFYFGILFVIGLIWGSDIFVSNWFTVAGVIILYPICYLIVRVILNKTGLRKY